MIGFWLKKNLCDLWDNMLAVVVPNACLLVLALACTFMFSAVGMIPQNAGLQNIYSYAALYVACAMFCTAVLAAGETAAKISRFESPSFTTFFAELRPCLKDGLLFALVVWLVISVATVTLPCYFLMWKDHGSFAGLILAMFVFWCVLVSVLSLQWFVPVRSLMHSSVAGCIKKSYVLFFDNAGFSLVMALNTVALCAISVVSLGTFPGVSGIAVTHTNALRLRMYKYDWLEVNPDLTKEERRDVPWDDLLATDKKTLGPRKWRSFLFPWKNEK